MAENLVRRWPRDRNWTFSFAWRWAVENGFNPKNFQDLLKTVGVEKGFGSDLERQRAFDVVRAIPVCGSDANFRRRAHAIGESHDLPRATIDEAVDRLFDLRLSRVP
ncbi:hypothetical protein [Phyllobacterium sp. YR620]|uniref:hypothetical protein n=1 Tax=Phyllobacterium sp. YR620 TaxID=1881066 RepID=UPI00111396F0|nr:hypothetical protein [Phyllobacterium sp. YR620]